MNDNHHHHHPNVKIPSKFASVSDSSDFSDSSYEGNLNIMGPVKPERLKISTGLASKSDYDQIESSNYKCPNSSSMINNLETSSLKINNPIMINGSHTTITNGSVPSSKANTNTTTNNNNCIHKNSVPIEKHDSEPVRLMESNSKINNYSTLKDLNLKIIGSTTKVMDDRNENIESKEVRKQHSTSSTISDVDIGQIESNIDSIDSLDRNFESGLVIGECTALYKFSGMIIYLFAYVSLFFLMGFEFCQYI